MAREEGISDLTGADGTRSGQLFRYCAYYLPILSWLPQYRLQWLRGDLIAALTVASLYIPMCFSFAILAQVNPVSSLYAFIIHPTMYALLGSCYQMVVGPEATGSLLVGAIVHRIRRERGNDYSNEEIASVVTAVSGVLLLAAGIGRIGFLDSMLNRPFMQGFISGVGFVLIIEQAIPELGLAKIAEEFGVTHSVPIVKLAFLITHLSKSHAITAVLSASTLLFILSFRAVQGKLRSRYPSLALMPDRLLVVVITTVLTWKLGLDERGVQILGPVGTSGPKIAHPQWPFSHFHLMEAVFENAFLAALLGFFESSVTAKSLRPNGDAPEHTAISANRELIAIGAANVVGGLFTTVPAFGGFGRSKLNVQAGGSTPMSSILLSIICVFCVFFVLPGLYYVPKAVLSAMATVVGISMMEEAPHNIRFFLKVRGWRELFLMSVVFMMTVCYSMSAGVVVGTVLTLFTLLQHTTKSRIRILGRTPGTNDTFEDAELSTECDQFDRRLIVKIPEPLTFANSGDLRMRLRRLEWYGVRHAHPSRPRSRLDDHFLIFDIQGLSAIDACATQVLAEIVEDHVRNGVQVIFCGAFHPGVIQRLRGGGIVDLCGGFEHFPSSLEEGLRLAGIHD